MAQTTRLTLHKNFLELYMKKKTKKRELLEGKCSALNGALRKLQEHATSRVQ